MLHEPSTPVGNDPSSPYKTRLGIWMFFAYCLVYAGFVAINLLAPTIMATIVILDLNLATCYGFGLIIIAIVAALIYNMFCNREEARMAEDKDVTTEMKGRN